MDTTTERTATRMKPEKETLWADGVNITVEAHWCFFVFHTKVEQCDSTNVATGIFEQHSTFTGVLFSVSCFQKLLNICLNLHKASYSTPKAELVLTESAAEMQRASEHVASHSFQFIFTELPTLVTSPPTEGHV